MLKTMEKYNLETMNLRYLMLKPEHENHNALATCHTYDTYNTGTFIIIQICTAS